MCARRTSDHWRDESRYNCNGKRKTAKMTATHSDVIPVKTGIQVNNAQTAGSLYPSQ